MFLLLRIIRGVCGFVFALQALHVIQSAAWLSTPEATGADTDKVLALLSIKLILLAIAGVLFFGFRWLINRLHIKMRGTPHPALADKTWTL